MPMHGGELESCSIQADNLNEQRRPELQTIMRVENRIAHVLSQGQLLLRSRQLFLCSP